VKIKTVIVGMLQTNCYIIEDSATGACAVVDPGANYQKISDALEGKKPQYIFLTHGHFDHILAARQLQQETGAKVYVHKADEEFLTEEYVINSGYVRGGYTSPKVDGYLEDGQTFEIGNLKLSVVSTKGHSKGSCVLVCGDCIFSGDTLFCESWGRCDFDGGDELEMIESLKKLALMAGDYKVFPGHGESTTLEHERQYNYLMRIALTR